MSDPSGSPVTLYSLALTAAIAIGGWITSAVRDRRTSEPAYLTAASEFVDRLMAEIERLNAEVTKQRSEISELRLAVVDCQQKHAETAQVLARALGN